jgi:uncharacterized protein (DUF58 family)
MRDYIPALIALLLLAVVARDDSVLTLFYLMAAVYFVGRWWSRRALRAVHFKRNFTAHAFPNEVVPVRLVLTNAGWLPVVWLSLHESLPAEISAALNVREIASLGPHGRRHFDYSLRTYKRGYYQVGPLFLGSGDLFGLHDDAGVQGGPDHLTVYPRVVPLSRLGLPSRSPLGTLRHTQPIFEDPSRVSGKRPYVSGDSLRRVDWKATAASGQLQVKLFDPSIALETMIFLDLQAGAYDLRYRFDATELAIVVAASLANWVVSRKQSVGLITNGADPLERSTALAPGTEWRGVPARKGKVHLIRILETLARIRMSDSTAPVAEMLRHQVVSLPWGTTLIVVTGRSDEVLFESLFRARRAGLNVVLIFTAPVPDFNRVRHRGEHFGFTVYQITRERDLEVWRP